MYLKKKFNIFHEKKKINFVGIKIRKGNKISMINIIITENWWNHSGSWWKYQERGVGMHVVS